MNENYQRALDLVQQEKEERERKVREDFGFEKDMSAFIEKEYFKVLRMMKKEVPSIGDIIADINNANEEVINSIKSKLEIRINYLDEKSKDDEEDMMYVMKLKLLLEELDKKLN